ncbi:TPA: hypothetical protein N0F65_001005 [Lagenidium giganteum]|uniref:Uncharacterized protein n=1 Tax=Lagenidium giganteum TaxID=4803 RepID=A0AAV2YZ97_9STRA|nr:TPA: hypothetical protein N0F65_001005 [Lagenidium giganteum]
MISETWPCMKVLAQLLSQFLARSITMDKDKFKDALILGTGR